MENQSSKKQPPQNLKEERAQYSFRIAIRDRDHFYKIVNWLNTNVGKGKDKWTMESRVLRALKRGVSPEPKIYIFIDNFNESSALWLTLI